MRDPFGIVGTTIDRRYEVRRVVAEGGFGVVYEAEAIALAVKVAIKVLRSEAVSSSPEARARFAQEAKLLARLRHPAIVALTDAAYLDDGTPYLALEWIDGETLDAYLERVGPLPLEDGLSLLGPVASAIAYAHDEGVVHRDLKPGNIMIGRDRRAKVLDFGVARWTSPHAVRTTTTSGTGLSIGFAAPEQYGKEFGPIDGRADQFALAAVVFAALTGVAPFHGDSLTEVMFATCMATERPSLARVRDDLPRAVDDVLQRALSIRPDRRFTTIRAFWSALEEAARHGDSALAPATLQAGPPTRTAGTQRAPATLPSPDAFSNPAPETIVQPSIGNAPTQPAFLAPPMTGPAGTRPTGKPSEEVPPSSMPPSTKVSPASRFILRLAVVATLGGAAAAAWPLLAPKPTVKTPVPNTKPSSKSPVSSAPKTDAPKTDCGKLPDDEACILGKRFLRGPDDCGVQDPPHKAACPATEVTVATFAIDRTELSIAKYERCALAGKCDAIDLDASKTTPIRKLTWAQAKKACDFYNKRLPTDDEWELAAGRDAYPWGNENPNLERAAFAETEGTAAPFVAVDALPKGATRDGLLNLAGNVAEWTSSRAGGDKRWVRGGSAETTAEALRTWAREAYPETTAATGIGVRCAHTPK